MPTASKFVASILFAALAWFVSDLYVPQLPEGTQVGLMGPVNALFGFIFGWRVMGKGVGHGMRTALGYGLTTALLITFWSIVFWSAYRMIVLSTRGRYDGPGDASAGFFSFIGEFGVLLVKPDIILSIFVGAFAFGWLSEHVARRYS